VVPCARGCSACCHGPFDISIADAELLRSAVLALPDADRGEVEWRAAVMLGRMAALEPAWHAPYAVADLGEEPFDRLTERLALEPCPLLDDAGGCRVYADRPLVCRLIGLPMITSTARVIENACPIQQQFPVYAALAPTPFDLEQFEEEEADCLREAAVRRFGDPAAAEFETTIAAAVARGGGAA
jgi:Fe-S-cluster containining protein